MNQAARSLLPLVLLSVFFARGEAHPAPLHPRNVGDIWADGLLFAERSTSDSTSGVYNLSSRDQNIADLTTLADQYGLIAQPWVWNFPAPGPAPGSSTNATAAVDVMTGQVLANVDGLILSRDGAEDDGSASSKDTAPLDEAASYANGWLVNNLNLYNSRAVVGDVNLAFVPDPLAVSTSASSAPAVGAPGQSVSVVGGDGVTIVQGANGADATTAPGGSAPTVLRVFYPNGSYSPSHSDPVGGTSFYPQPFLPPVLPGGSNQSPYTNALASNSSALSSAVNVQSQTGTAATSSSFPSLLLSYSVGFPANFDFVKGGKLPGLYSSVGLLRPNGTLDANTDGCSGGARDGVGESCWSARVMWRENGEGEVYAYFPTNVSGSYDPCGQRKTLICNDAYGTSIGRGSFTFKRGGYTNVTLLVQLNSDPSLANGVIRLWVDGQPVVDEEDLLLRIGTVPTVKTGKGGGSAGKERRAALPGMIGAGSGSGIGHAHASALKRDGDINQGAAWVDKVFFSTFFGGSTADYGAHGDTETYYKDFSLYAGTKASGTQGVAASGGNTDNKTGAKSGAIALRTPLPSASAGMMTGLVTLFALLAGLV